MHNKTVSHNRMENFGHKPELFRWQRHTQSDRQTCEPVHTLRFTYSQSAEALDDHHDVYSEAQALLSEWMERKLYLQKNTTHTPLATPKQTATHLQYNSFHKQSVHLDDEGSEVQNFLQDLLDKKVVEPQLEKSVTELCMIKDVPHTNMRERMEKVSHTPVWKEKRPHRERKRRNLEQHAPLRVKQNDGSDTLRVTFDPTPTVQQLHTGRLHRMEMLKARLKRLDMQCLHRHFSLWYCLVLERRVSLGKAAALCDWRNQRRVWQAWWTLVWDRRTRIEAEKTEEELRRCEVILKRRRLCILRRCVTEWRAVCQAQCERRELVCQQEETQRKISALLQAAATGTLKRQKNRHTAHFVPEIKESEQQNGARQGQDTQTHTPTQAYTRCSTPQSLQMVEQQEKCVPQTATAGCIEQEPRRLFATNTATHPIVRAMEDRARLRAARRKEVEERKRVREEEQLAQVRALEEQKLREEEQEKRVAAERRKEEKERELEKQCRLQLLRRQISKAQEHRHRTLLLHWGMLPWKRLVGQSHAHRQRAEHHHRLYVLRSRWLWWQHVRDQRQVERQLRADTQYQHTLLRKCVYSWRKLKHISQLQDERAHSLYRHTVLRKVVQVLLGHATTQRLARWDRERLAQQHRDRCVLSNCLRAWMDFLTLLRREREREIRRERLRRRVTEVLPDFSPQRCHRLQIDN